MMGLPWEVADEQQHHEDGELNKGTIHHPQGKYKRMN